jgi:hypothetical protein
VKSLDGAQILAMSTLILASNTDEALGSDLDSLAVLDARTEDIHHSRPLQPHWSVYCIVHSSALRPRQSRRDLGQSPRFALILVFSVGQHQRLSLT